MPATKIRSHGTFTSSKYSTASFSSKRLDSGLSNTDIAFSSYDLRDRIFIPFAFIGTANDSAYISSPSRSGWMQLQNTSFAMIPLVASIFAPRTVMPSAS